MIKPPLQTHAEEAGVTLWKSRECGKESKTKIKLEAQIATHLEGFKHVCSNCNHHYKTRNSLQGNKCSVHKEKKVKVELKTESTSDDLKALSLTEIALKKESTSDDLNA